MFETVNGSLTLRINSVPRMTRKRRSVVQTHEGLEPNKDIVEFAIILSQLWKPSKRQIRARANTLKLGMTNLGALVVRENSTSISRKESEKLALCSTKKLAVGAVLVGPYKGIRKLSQ